jgi:large subunit ribosomal protein L9
MKVVFLEDVPGTANIGDIKDVKPGFARNYLLPRRLAMAATPAVVKSAEARAQREARLQEARDAEARKTAEKIDGITITVTARAGNTGKLFGSVGAAEIAGRVGELIGAEVDRHNVLLREPIKELGDFPVGVRLTKNVSATVTVTVIGEDGTTAADIRAKAEPEAGSASVAPPAGVEQETDESAGADAYAVADDGETGPQE